MYGAYIINFEHRRQNFGALLHSIIGNFKSIIDLSLPYANLLFINKCLLNVGMQSSTQLAMYSYLNCNQQKRYIHACIHKLLLYFIVNYYECADKTTDEFHKCYVYFELTQVCSNMFI